MADISKNMLEQFYHKIKELNLLKEKIIRIENSNNLNIEDFLSSFDDLSFIKKYYDYDYKKEIVTINILKKLWIDGLCELESELILIEQYINSIDDSEIRQIVRYKYLDNFTWNKTALKVYGYPCGDRARKRIDRFFCRDVRKKF